MPAKYFNLLPLAARSVAALTAGDSFAIQTITMANVALRVTAYTGAPTLTAWLQGQDPTSAAWFDLPVDQQMTYTGTATDVAAVKDYRNITGAVAALASSPMYYTAVYRHLAAQNIRVAYIISGTGTVTFQVDLAGK